MRSCLEWTEICLNPTCFMMRRTIFSFRACVRLSSLEKNRVSK